MTLAPTVPVEQHDPVVESFAIAAQIRMTAAGTTVRLTIALPDEVTVTASGFVPALLTLGQRVLEEHRLTGRELPEVEVTAVERAEELPAGARTTGFTVGVINDMAARRSSIVLDSDFLLGNDGGVLLAAATLLAGAEHLLEIGERTAPQYTSGKPKAPKHNRKNPRRSRGRGRR
ncbi:hypothetical protein GCM10011374_36430 [Kocuria dechangensis]|uniref:Uncharacterized protein n=1 Tax=Kocuria dechangensis TaxID=1176249 RepID=A0A917LZ92_9MICC|nr:hypothetical protein [Kocuria dechangensis]GGG68737.1 hypothetical protein GCM10011374_36430 [Kocuria dechangensis]